MIKVQQHLGFLGYKVKDRVTGFSGIVTSVSFDLYGCIQATVHPGMKEDGTFRDQNWFDLNRLEIISQIPVMLPPNYSEGYQASGLQGAAEKPKFGKA